MDKLEKEIFRLIHDYETPKRIAFSRKYPGLKNIIILLRHFERNVRNFLGFRIRCQIRDKLFDYTVARHQSVLRRRLGDSNPKLQEQKIINLKKAIQRLNGVIIEPNNIFSFWKILGKPKYKSGYVDGMLLSNGKIIEGVGGGLCQLSNFLYWIFLHTPVETVERHHHSVNVFPDSDRTLPFGGGATILYNFIDLKVKNISRYPLQLKIWLTDNHLKGQVLSSHPISEKFHIFEKNSLFIKRGRQYFRYNEIYKQTKLNGKIENVEKVTTNFAPVLYAITREYLLENNFKVLDFTDR